MGSVMLSIQTIQTRKLGNSDLQITPLGVGAWAIGGGGLPFAWGPQDDNDSIDAIHAALDRGINWIDTAPVYGFGHSEDIVGRALKSRSFSGQPSRPYVFTKCSIVWNENREASRSMKLDSIRRECEESLRRLQIDALDLYQVHWPDPEPDIEEGWSAVAELQQGRQSPLDWRFELQARSNGPHSTNRADHLFAAALLHTFAGNRSRNSSLLRAAQYRRDRLLTHEIRPAHRRDDS
jgi:hypothetical protein